MNSKMTHRRYPVRGAKLKERESEERRSELQGAIERCSLHTARVPEGEGGEEEAENLLREIMAEHVSSMDRTLYFQIHEAYRTLKSFNSKRMLQQVETERSRDSYGYARENDFARKPKTTYQQAEMTRREEQGHYTTSQGSVREDAHPTSGHLNVFSKY